MKRNAFAFQFARQHPEHLIGKRRRYGFAYKKSSRQVASSAARSDVALALRGQGYSAADAKKAAQRASGSDFDSMFRSALNLKKGNPMSKKKKKKSRKGTMPAGLKAYWAKHRRPKSKRKNSRRRKTRNRRTRTKTVVRTRTKIVYRNPPKRKRRRTKRAPARKKGAIKFPVRLKSRASLKKIDTWLNRNFRRK